MRISVIGGEVADAKAARLAFEVGREVGARGHVLICGGRSGVMREACRGAKESGGLTVGILPGDDLADVNEFVDIPLPTGIGYTRNVLVARAGEAVIAIDGKFGTLSEIAFALISGRPVIGLARGSCATATARMPPSTASRTLSAPSMPAKPQSRYEDAVRSALRSASP